MLIVKNNFLSFIFSHSSFDKACVHNPLLSPYIIIVDIGLHAWLDND